MKFLLLTNTLTDAVVYVNPDNILYFQTDHTDDSRTVIRFEHSAAYVRETVDQVKLLLEGNQFPQLR